MENQGRSVSHLLTDHKFPPIEVVFWNSVLLTLLYSTFEQHYIFYSAHFISIQKTYTKKLFLAHLHVHELISGETK